jgi:hypothetical protein
MLKKADLCFGIKTYYDKRMIKSNLISDLFFIFA